MNSATLKKFIGVPVVVQLRSLICMVTVNQKQSLSYADSPETPQWMPAAIMQSSPEGDRPSVTQLIEYAVLREIEGSDTHLEMTFSAPTSLGVVATLVTLVARAQIDFVTRVSNMPEGSARSASKILLAT